MRRTEALIHYPFGPEIKPVCTWPPSSRLPRTSDTSTCCFRHVLRYIQSHRPEVRVSRKDTFEDSRRSERRRSTRCHHCCKERNQAEMSVPLGQRARRRREPSAGTKVFVTSLLLSCLPAFCTTAFVVPAPAATGSFCGDCGNEQVRGG